MSAIWHNDGAGWRLLAPTGFPAEAALHKLVEEAPQILPLAGTPQLIVVGKEVLLVNGYADLLAIEPSGRLVVIEIKLARNAEARRAVVAQVLTYAAYLKGLDPLILERDILGVHLRGRGYENLAGAVAANDQEGSFDPAAFAEGLAESLSTGRFRLVIVLDEAPEELVRLVGYLGSMADKLIIDLITVAAYIVNGSQVIVPQRVEPERVPATAVPAPLRPQKSEGHYSPGAEEFAACISRTPAEQREALRRLCDWALSLERQGPIKLATFQGTSNRVTLLPRLQADNAGLVTIWNDQGAYISLWRSVFERRVPKSLVKVEQLIAPAKVGQGTVVHAITDELLEALKQAYQEVVEGTRDV